MLTGTATQNGTARTTAATKAAATKTVAAMTCASVALLALGGCLEKGVPEPNNQVGYRCDQDGVCAGRENGLNCPEDCYEPCPEDLSELGPSRLLIVSQLNVPRDTATEVKIGADLDHDGEIDNRWGAVYRMSDDTLECLGPPDHALERGELVLLARLYGDATVEGSLVGLQLLPPGDSLTPVQRDGTDAVYRGGPVPPAVPACGRVRGGVFNLGPAAGPTPFGLLVNKELPLLATVWLHRVVIRGQATDGGASLEITAGGGFFPDDLRRTTFPRLADLLTREPPAECQPLVDWIDDECEPLVESCDHDEVACAPDGRITVTELRCNPYLSSLYSPDLDVDDDFRPDLLSVGFEATLVPATLAAACGDGTIQPEFGEQCDGAVAPPYTCADLGFAAGDAVLCTACRVDSSLCSQLCGDRDCAAPETSLLCPADCAPALVAAGAESTAALLGDGGLVAWGENDTGQLGLGEAGDPVNRPVRSPLVDNATALALGAGHGCVILQGGDVQCWGANDHGQLGDGTTDSTPQPQLQRVALPAPARQLAVAVHHGCARLQGGAVWCWGENAWSQSGQPAPDPVPLPAPVPALPPAVDIATGARHGCAVSTDGRVRCWGANTHEQLGQPNPLGSPGAATSGTATPLAVPGISDAVQVVAGVAHTCARHADGRVSCWGEGLSGQLGHGAFTSSATPMAVAELPAAAQLAAGGFHTCALATDGTLWCWGHNIRGQLGTGAYDSSAAPAPLDDLEHVRIAAVRAGLRHTCALDTTAALHCWGDNRRHQLGLGLDGAFSERRPTRPLPW
jgi:alpha-tubulin suppressor-like RCC1 family protein